MLLFDSAEPEKALHRQRTATQPPTLLLWDRFLTIQPQPHKPTQSLILQSVI
nr:MAG TPA: hypothetical protein [Caudoviricetes sp.]